MKYLVAEIDYQYNDEYYYTPEGEPYYAYKIFNTQKEAEEAAEEANLARVMDDPNYVVSYINPYDEIDTEEFRFIVHQLGGKIKEDVWDIEMPKTLSREAALLLLEKAQITFFKVVEVSE